MKIIIRKKVNLFFHFFLIFILFIVILNFIESSIFQKKLYADDNGIYFFIIPGLNIPDDNLKHETVKLGIGMFASMYYRLDGLAISTLFNTGFKVSTGFQIAGFFNTNFSTFEGFQISCIFNFYIQGHSL